MKNSFARAVVGVVALMALSAGPVLSAEGNAGPAQIANNSMQSRLIDGECWWGGNLWGLFGVSLWGQSPQSHKMIDV
jgi:hypothetical protein